MGLTIQSPQIMHQIVRKQNYVTQIQGWLELNRHSLSVFQVAEYEEVIQKTNENIEILKRQLRNHSSACSSN
jgi:hypothetical protein